MSENLPLILKQLRAKKDVGQKEIADYLEIDRSTYTKYETGQNSPDYEKILKLAKYYSVTVDYLLGKSPFINRKEAECSVRVAAIKEALSDPANHNFIWSRAIENTKTGFGFTDNTMQYIKNLRTKENLTNIEYYDLSLFVAWDIEWPDDFNGPAILAIWETRISCNIDYWSIPKILIEEWQSNIKYKEPVYDGPMPNPEEAFGGENTYIPQNEIDDILETLHKRPEMKVLFSATKNATKEDIEKAVKIIEALRDK